MIDLGRGFSESTLSFLGNDDVSLYDNHLNVFPRTFGFNIVSLIEYDLKC